MGKAKGTRFERELFHKFNEAGWQPIRAAGSGSTPIDCVDLVVGNSSKKKVVAVECKVSKATTKYMHAEDILQLKEFAHKFGAEEWIAIKFDHQGTYFIKPSQLEKTKKNYYILPLERCREKGFSFESFVSQP